MDQKFALLSRRACVLAAWSAALSAAHAQWPGMPVGAAAKPVDWSMVQTLAKGQPLQSANGLRLAVPAVAAVGTVQVDASSQLGALNWLALFVQVGAQTDRLLVTAFDCTKSALPGFSVSVKFAQTCRFYLAAMAQDSVWVAQAETKLALLQAPPVR